ncbi:MULTISPECIES: hypothetical protein [Burkholderia cepacia complex]|uniref:hypothetical protein n=1 Tax=Burkholderia cepacia complex TaxID=87882 RepID=UPI001581F96E|nr:MULTISPECIES: hypothetical protein [Burkholderia cepacia complex]
MRRRHRGDVSDEAEAATGLIDGGLHARHVRRSAAVNFCYSCRTKKITVRHNRIIGTHFDDESLILIAHESR